MARNKRKPIENVEIIDIAEKAHCIGRAPDGQIVMVSNCVPGDVVNVETRRKKKSMWWCVPTDFLKKSEFRINAFCQHHDFCGGCQWQNLEYAKQLEFKEKKVKNAIQRIGGQTEALFLPILAAEETQYYRNKLEYSFSNLRWLSPDEIEHSDEIINEGGVGFYPAGSHSKVIDLEACYLQTESSNAIRNRVKSFAKEQNISFYNGFDKTGFLRQLLIRTTETGQIMVVLSVGEKKPKLAMAILDDLMAQFPSIKSSFYTINLKQNNFLYDLDMIHHAGEKQIMETLGHLDFLIGPKSFFQTNTKQGKRLYDTVAEFADLKGSENLYDLYSGIGSIGLYLANKAGSVVGVEEISSAVEDAKINAQKNAIKNATFYDGLVRDILTEDFQKKHGKPDVLITDPPRAGMHPKVIDLLIELKAPKLVYVSCNPATQARDIKMLSDHYELVKVKAVDMFPQTSHIESVALLILKND